jgi:hypothetical protein
VPNASVIAELPRNLSAELVPSDGKTHAGVHPDSIFVPVLPGKQHENTSKSHLPTVLYTINEFPLESSPLSTTFNTNPSAAPSQEQPDSVSRTEPLEQHAASSSFFEAASQRYESSFSQFAACCGGFFALGDTSGRVGLWIVRPDSFSTWRSMLLTLHFPSQFTLPSLAGRVSDGWKGSEPPQAAVSTSIVLEDALLLIRGHGILCLCVFLPFCLFVVSLCHALVVGTGFLHTQKMDRFPSACCQQTPFPNTTKHTQHE